MLASLSISVTVDLYCVLSQASYLLRQLDMACVYEGSHSFDLHFTGVCDTASGMQAAVNNCHKSIYG